MVTGSQCVSKVAPKMSVARCGTMWHDVARARSKACSLVEAHSPQYSVKYLPSTVLVSIEQYLCAMQQALISFQCAVYIEQYLSAMQALIYSECAPVSQGTVPVCAHSVSTGSCLLFARDDVALLHQTLTQRSHITDIDIWPESEVINGKYVRQTQETASNTDF